MRYGFLDVAKGITIIFVLMAHSCGFPFGTGRYCTAYFMAFFFVASGYMQKSTVIDKEYLYRRIKKIVIPYFYYNFLIFIIYFVWEGFESFQEVVEVIIGVFYSTYCIHFPIDLEKDFFCYRIYNNATWYLTAFFCANMIFLLYRKYCVKNGAKVIVFIVFAIITQILYYCPIFLPWNMDKAFIGADFMILGYEMQRKNILEISFNWFQITLAGVLIAVYMFLADFNPGINLATREYGNRGIFSVGLYILIGISGSVLCIWIGRLICKIPIISTFFSVLGKEVLPVMAMHLIIFHIFDQAMKLWMPTEFESPYYWSFAILRIIVTCILILGVVYGVRYVKRKRKEIYMG